MPTLYINANKNVNLMALLFEIIATIYLCDFKKDAKFKCGENCDLHYVNILYRRTTLLL